MEACAHASPLIVSRSDFTPPLDSGPASAMLRSVPLLRLARAAPRGLVGVRGHCQVPCGIFDDPMIVAEINQACATIRKAMVQINELSGAAAGSAQTFNQMTRWVNTKEEHCAKIIDLVANCVEIKILRRVCAESSRRPPRRRRDACSMAW